VWNPNREGTGKFILHVLSGDFSYGEGKILTGIYITVKCRRHYIRKGQLGKKRTDPISQFKEFTRAFRILNGKLRAVGEYIQRKGFVEI